MQLVLPRMHLKPGTAHSQLELGTDYTVLLGNDLRTLTLVGFLQGTRQGGARHLHAGCNAHAMLVQRQLLHAFIAVAAADNSSCQDGVGPGESPALAAEARA